MAKNEHISFFESINHFMVNVGKCFIMLYGFVKGQTSESVYSRLKAFHQKYDLVVLPYKQLSL